jgi:hypothetical protein
MFGKKTKSEEIEEKRKCERVMVNLPVTIEIVYTSEISTVNVGDKFEGRTINFSHGGIFIEDGLEKFGTGGMLIECKQEIPAFSKVNISLKMPLPGYTESFVVEAFVVRTEYQYEDDVYYIAVSFNSIVDHDFSEGKLEEIRKILNI